MPLKTTTKIKPISLYFPISRIDEDNRIVEGYAFVNETVPGEGGVRLRRSAMEEATSNYIENGTCRELHQPSAAGKPLSVEWDDKGAYLRMECVDDMAWKKVQRGVYKGFSVSVTPQVMRGKDVTVCEWWDTSLVDLGKDRDAKISCWRTKDIDLDTEVEVEVEAIDRATFADYLNDCAPSALRDMALDYLWNSLWDIQYSEGTPEEKEAAVRATCGDFTEFMVGAIASGTLPQLTDTDRAAGLPTETHTAPAPPELTRAVVETFLCEVSEVAIPAADFERYRVSDQTISTLTGERDGLSSELSRVQGLLVVAEGEVTTLKNTPARKPPVRNIQPVERTFAGNIAPKPEDGQITTLRTELTELQRMAPTANPYEGDKRVARISQIRRSLRELGEAA